MTDLIARLLSRHLSGSLSQPVAVENRPGGIGGAIGVKAAAGATADGYTLLFGSPGTLAITPAIYSNVGYDPAKVFTAVATVAISPQVLVVNPGVPAQSVHDLIAYAKANPGKISFASPGYGTQSHLLGELLKTTAGINIVHVPYNGTAAAIADLVDGRVQMSFAGPAVVAPHIKAGQLRALAVASESRAPLLPDVPTMIESGFGRFIANYWAAVAAPMGTQEKVIGRLNGVIDEVLRTSDLQAGLAKLGARAKIGTPEEAADFIAGEAAKWSMIAKAAGVSGTETSDKP